jgi:hypothetical protein
MCRNELTERRAKLMAGKKWSERELQELRHKEENEMRVWRTEARKKVTATASRLARPSPVPDGIHQCPCSGS